MNEYMQGTMETSCSLVREVVKETELVIIGVFMSLDS
jgi:hypothetical protein